MADSDLDDDLLGDPLDEVGARDDLEEDDEPLEEFDEPEDPDVDEPDVDDLADGDDLADADAGTDVDPEGLESGGAPAGVKGAEDDDEEDEEDDEDSDDVEASLDAILKARLVAPEDEEEEDEDAAGDADERGDSVLKVLPKQPGEFVCQSCFLVKHPSQLADPERSLCRDCV